MVKIKIYLILILVVLQSCTSKSAKIIEDVIEGEVKVAENVIDDVSGIPQSQPILKKNIIKF